MTRFPRRSIGCSGSSGTICSRERGIKASSAAQYQPTARLFLSERSEPLEEDLARVSAARGQHVRVAGVPAALAALDRNGGLRTPRAAAVLARARVDRGAARGGGAIGRAAPGGSPARAAGRAGEALVGQLRSRDTDRASRLRDRSAACPGWGCVAARSPRSRSTTSTGGRARSWFMARDRGSTGCRCLATSGRRSWTISVMVARAWRIARCSSTRARRCAASLAGASPMWCGMPACGRGSRRSARIACGTRSPPSCLRHGAGLVEIGQVLRHQDQTTTAVYAKVDRAALSPLALPWPGSER